MQTELKREEYPVRIEITERLDELLNVMGYR